MKTIREHIKNGTFSTCYLLFGKDDYMIHLYTNKLIHAIVAEDDSMNYQVFRNEIPSANEVREIAETVPFFADRRLIVIYDSGWFKKENTFSAFIPDIPETTTLLFIESNVEKTSELYKAVKENGYVSEMNGLSDEELNLFIASTLKKSNLSISPSAAEYLLERVGSDMNLLSTEVEKLASYCLGNVEVTVSDIRKVTSVISEGQIFAMMDAIMNNDRKKATSLYAELLSAQEKPLRILYNLTNTFFSFYKVLSFADTGMSQDDIASNLSLRPFVVKKYIRLKKRWSYERILSAVKEGNEMEQKVKSGDLEEHMAVEMFLFRYTSVME